MARPPASLNDFIGQHRVIALVRKLIAGARLQEEAVASLLLLGPPGMGKTALAEAIAREYGGTRTGPLSTWVRILGGPRMTSRLVERLAGLSHGDFLFIDEVHALDQDAQELLHLALDERKTLGCREDGRLDRGTTRSIAEFTLIGASTEPGKVTQALRSRLHQIVLDPYELLELKTIAERAGKALGMELTPQAAKHLAERSQRTPRSIEKLLKHLSVTRAPRPASGSSVKKIDQAVVRSFLDEVGIDERGLGTFQQQYVQILAAAAGGVVSLNVITSRLGIDRVYIQADVEPHLLHLRLIDVGPRGRTLTEKGRAVADEMARAAIPPEQETSECSATEEDVQVTTAATEVTS